MSDRLTIARPYARAAFAAAQERGTVAAWSEALHTARRVIEDPRVHELIGNPHVSAEQLADLVVEVGGELGTEWHELMHTLAQNGRLTLLPEIAALFDERKNEEDGVIDVTVTAARQLSAAQEEKLSLALSRRLKRKVRLHTALDAALIGGAKIQAGDLVIDGSLRTRLERLALELSE